MSEADNRTEVLAELGGINRIGSSLTPKPVEVTMRYDALFVVRNGILKRHIPVPLISSVNVWEHGRYLVICVQGEHDLVLDRGMGERSASTASVAPPPAHPDKWGLLSATVRTRQRASGQVTPPRVLTPVTSVTLYVNSNKTFAKLMGAIVKAIEAALLAPIVEMNAMHMTDTLKLEECNLRKPRDYLSVDKRMELRRRASHKVVTQQTVFGWDIIDAPLPPPVDLAACSVTAQRALQPYRIVMVGNVLLHHGLGVTTSMEPQRRTLAFTATRIVVYDEAVDKIVFSACVAWLHTLIVAPPDRMELRMRVRTSVQLIDFSLFDDKPKSPFMLKNRTQNVMIVAEFVVALASREGIAVRTAQRKPSAPGVNTTAASASPQKATTSPSLTRPRGSSNAPQTPRLPTEELRKKDAAKDERSPDATMSSPAFYLTASASPEAAAVRKSPLPAKTEASPQAVAPDATVSAQRVGVPSSFFSATLAPKCTSGSPTYKLRTKSNLLQLRGDELQKQMAEASTKKESPTTSPAPPVPLKPIALIRDYCKPAASLSSFTANRTLLARSVQRMTTKSEWVPRVLVLVDGLPAASHMLVCSNNGGVKRDVQWGSLVEVNMHKDGTAVFKIANERALVVKTSAAGAFTAFDTPLLDVLSVLYASAECDFSITCNDAEALDANEVTMLRKSDSMKRAARAMKTADSQTSSPQLSFASSTEGAATNCNSSGIPPTSILRFNADAQQPEPVSALHHRGSVKKSVRFSNEDVRAVLHQSITGDQDFGEMCSTQVFEYDPIGDIVFTAMTQKVATEEQFARRRREIEEEGEQIAAALLEKEGRRRLLKKEREERKARQEAPEPIQPATCSDVGLSIDVQAILELTERFAAVIVQEESSSRAEFQSEEATMRAAMQIQLLIEKAAEQTHRQTGSFAYESSPSSAAASSPRWTPPTHTQSRTMTGRRQRVQGDCDTREQPRIGGAATRVAATAQCILVAEKTNSKDQQANMWGMQLLQEQEAAERSKQTADETTESFAAAVLHQRLNALADATHAAKQQQAKQRQSIVRDEGLSWNSICEESGRELVDFEQLAVVKGIATVMQQAAVHAALEGEVREIVAEEAAARADLFASVATVFATAALSKMLGELEAEEARMRAENLSAECSERINAAEEAGQAEADLATKLQRLAVDSMTENEAEQRESIVRDEGVSWDCICEESGRELVDFEQLAVVKGIATVMQQATVHAAVEGEVREIVAEEAAARADLFASVATVFATAALSKMLGELEAEEARMRAENLSAECSERINAAEEAGQAEADLATKLQRLAVDSMTENEAEQRESIVRDEGVSWDCICEESGRELVDFEQLAVVKGIATVMQQATVHAAVEGEVREIVAEEAAARADLFASVATVFATAALSKMLGELEAEEARMRAENLSAECSERINAAEEAGQAEADLATKLQRLAVDSMTENEAEQRESIVRDEGVSWDCICEESGRELVDFEQLAVVRGIATVMQQAAVHAALEGEVREIVAEEAAARADLFASVATVFATAALSKMLGELEAEEARMRAENLSAECSERINAAEEAGQAEADLATKLQRLAVDSMTENEAEQRESIVRDEGVSWDCICEESGRELVDFEQLAVVRASQQ